MTSKHMEAVNHVSYIINGEIVTGDKTQEQCFLITTENFGFIRNHINDYTIYYFPNMKICFFASNYAPKISHLKILYYFYHKYVYFDIIWIRFQKSTFKDQRK